MPSDTALVTCDICNKQRRLNGECHHCAEIEKKRLKEEEWQKRRERRREKKCIYCKKPAGKITITSYKYTTGDPGSMSGETERMHYSGKMEDDDVIIVTRYRNTVGHEYRSDPQEGYDVAHKECRRKHLRKEAKRLQKEADEILD